MRSFLKSFPVGRAAIFAINFGLAKAVAFAGPLLLAFNLDAATYGALELSLAWGLMLSLVLSLGLPSAYPQLTLRRRPLPFRDVLGFILAATMLGLLAAAASSRLAGAPSVVAMAFVVTALSAFQGTASVLAQTHSKRNLAAWSTSFATIVVVIVALACKAVGMLPWLTVALAAVAILFASSALRDGWQSRQAGFLSRLAIALPVAVPLFAAALVSVWIGNSPRILLGLTVSLDDIAVYAMLFRVAAITLLFHQLMSLGLFARIYTERMRVFDRFASGYIFALALVLAVIVIAFPVVVSTITPSSVPPARLAEAEDLFPIVALQVYGWLAGGALEARIGRVRRAGRLAVASAVVAASTIVALLTASAMGGGLRTLVLALTVQSLVIPVVMLLVLWQRGALLRRFAVGYAAGVVGLVIISVFR